METFWYQLTQVHLEKWQLKWSERVCVIQVKNCRRIYIGDISQWKGICEVKFWTPVMHSHSRVNRFGIVLRLWEGKIGIDHTFSVRERGQSSQNFGGYPICMRIG